MNNLNSEFEFYLSKKDEFLKTYPGKFIAIKNKTVLGVYNDRLEAINETRKNHELGTFIVQHVTKDDDQLRFHSRHAG